MFSEDKMLVVWLFMINFLLLIQGYPHENRIRRREPSDIHFSFHESHETETDGDKPIVFLTVSSLASKTEQDRLLELNWDRLPPSFEEADALVGLYDHDPFQDSHEPIVSTRPENSEGYFKTSIRFPEQKFSKHNLTNDCLNFWIAYVENDEILSTNCIRARPNWMHEARSAIGNLSLMDLMIPGTHNAGAYATFNETDDTLFYKYLLTQEEDVWSQMVYGIRYLDLRVAYQTSLFANEKLWITHSSFATDNSVKDVLKQVKDFLDNTNEIVIMDFHRFTNGFKGRKASKRHKELVSMLEDKLGNYMIPTNFTPWSTLNSLWEAGKRLYVGYADDSTRRSNSLLFPAVKHLWGEVDTLPDLKSYLNRTVCNNRNRRLTSAMAQLTPTMVGTFFNIYGGLRDMADKVNREITKWFRDNWSDCANIIATDFFKGNNIIEIAIETNKKKQL